MNKKGKTSDGIDSADSIIVINRSQSSIDINSTSLPHQKNLMRIIEDNHKTVRSASMNNLELKHDAVHSNAA